MRYIIILMKAGLFLAFVVLLISCESSSQVEQRVTEEVAALKEEVVHLEDEIIELQCEFRKQAKDQIERDLRVYELDRELSKLKTDFQLNKKVDKLVFNVKKSDGFEVLESSSGIFFVSVKDVQPHLDGHKITFSIGNPSNITFSNPKIKLRWNSPFDFKKINTKLPEDEFKKHVSELSDEWKKSFKEKEFSVLKEFSPGSWSQVELYLSPSSLTELEWVEFSIDAPNVILYKD